MKRGFVISAVITCVVLSIAAFLQASGIVPAIVPSAVPATSRRGSLTPAAGAGIFQLASSTAAGSVGSVLCDDGTGETTTTGCTLNAVTSTSPVTVNANVITDQQLMELSLPAGYLNSLGRPFGVASEGVYTTQAGQTPTTTFKLKLCTVAGCGSGTVVTLVSITSTVTQASSTNFNWGLNVNMATAATGATGNLEAHGLLNIDLSSSPSAADSVFGDTNTGVSGNIDLTAALFLDTTIAFSTNAATANICQQRLGIIGPGGSTAGGGGSTVTVVPPFLTVSSANYGPVWSLGTVPTAGWTSFGVGVVFDTTSGYPYVHAPTGSGAANLTGAFRTAPATPYSAIFTIIHDTSNGQGSNTAACTFCGYTVGFTDTTKHLNVIVGDNGGYSATYTRWTNATTVSSVPLTLAGAGSLDLIYRNPSVWKVCDDGTNLRFFWSIDGGNHFVATYTETDAAFFGVSPGRVEFGAYNSTGASEVAVVGFSTTAACP